jgi:hypothetical protein
VVTAGGARDRFRAPRLHYSRRGFLVVAGAFAGALLAGCGRDAARERPPTDAEVIGGLLERERAAGAAVAAVAGAGAVAMQDELHAGRLTQLAGTHAGAADAPAGSGPGGLATALGREQESLFAYVAALPRLADPDLRVLAMQLAASEAEHMAALRLAAGREPAPDAFAGFTEPGP